MKKCLQKIKVNDKIIGHLNNVFLIRCKYGNDFSLAVDSKMINNGMHAYLVVDYIYGGYYTFNYQVKNHLISRTLKQDNKEYFTIEDTLQGKLKTKNINGRYLDSYIDYEYGNI